MATNPAGGKSKVQLDPFLPEKEEDLVLRQRLCTVQVVVQGKDLCAFSCGLPTESVVDVYATVSVPPAPIA